MQFLRHFLALHLLLVLVLFQDASSALPCCSVCDCKARVVWCERRSLTSIPTDIPADTMQLYLFDNEISNIPDGSLSKLKYLKELDLRSNKLTSLNPGVFSKLTSLTDLNLSENKLSTVPENVFSGMNKLVRLYLEDNQIENIEENAIKNLNHLVELKLSNNRLQDFPTIRSCPALRRLCLNHNRLVGLREASLYLINLEQLMLSDNQLIQLSSTAFQHISNMRELDISNNHINVLPAIISNMTSLHTLNLSGNAITSLPLNLLGNLRRMKVLDLQGLRLTTLPKSFIPRRVYLNIFDISNNPWTCDCATSWLPEYMRAVEGAILRGNQVKCNMPQALHERPIVALRESDFACDKHSTLMNSRPRLTPVLASRRKPTVDLCDGLSCANEAKCFIDQKTGRPKCRCQEGWEGLLCNQLILKPTTPTPKTTSTRLPSNDDSSKLFFHEQSLTSNSVGILVPTVGKQITVIITELVAEGKQAVTKRILVRPKNQFYTVTNLLPGKKYKICIKSVEAHSLSISKTLEVEDQLCCDIETKSVEVEHSEKGAVDEEEEKSAPADISLQNKGDGEKPLSHEVSAESNVKVIDRGSEVSVKTSANQSAPLLPIVLAGVGAFVIMVSIIIFCVYCRKKNKLKQMNQNGMFRHSQPKLDVTDKFSLNQDTEIVSIMPRARLYQAQPNFCPPSLNRDVYQSSQQSFQTCEQYARGMSSPKTESLERSSTSGSSVNGTMPYLDFHRSSSTNSGSKYTASAAIEVTRSSSTPNGSTVNGVVPYNRESSNRKNEFVHRHHGSPALPVETNFLQGFRNTDVSSEFSANGAFSQYESSPVSTASVYPSSSYHQAIHNTPQIISYTPIPPATLAQQSFRNSNTTPNKKRNYPNVSGKSSLNFGSRAQNSLTSPYRINNEVHQFCNGHMTT